jgi:superfamily II DNA helicase RecQ
MAAIPADLDALVALPTGFGQSLIDQVPAILKLPMIVISPLMPSWLTRNRSSLRSYSSAISPIVSKYSLRVRRFCHQIAGEIPLNIGVWLWWMAYHPMRWSIP